MAMIDLVYRMPGGNGRPRYFNGNPDARPVRITSVPSRQIEMETITVTKEGVTRKTEILSLTPQQYALIRLISAETERKEKSSSKD